MVRTGTLPWGSGEQAEARQALDAEAQDRLIRAGSGLIFPTLGWPENSSCWDRLLETSGFGALGAWHVPEQVEFSGRPPNRVKISADPARPQGG